MNKINVEHLLGQEFSDEIVQKAIRYFELPKKRPKVPRGDSYIGIESHKEGVDINFTPVENIDFLADSNYPEGALLVTAIFLYRGGVADHQEFKDPLPHGLSFAMTRADARSLLGTPSWSSPVLPIDRWVFGKYKLVIDFSESEKLIDSVTLQLIGK